MKQFRRFLSISLVFLLPYLLAVWCWKSTGFQFSCVYLVPFFGHFAALFLPHGSQYTETTLFLMCVQPLSVFAPFIYLFVRARHKLRIGCVLWTIWILFGLLVLVEWQYESKATPSHPIYPPNNQLICWKYVSSKTDPIQKFGECLFHSPHSNQISSIATQEMIQAPFVLSSGDSSKENEK